MRVARWRWVLVLMIVLVASCQEPPPAVPASLLSKFSGKDGHPTFTVKTPPAGQTGQDVVDALRFPRSHFEPVFDGRAIPVFGVVDCHGVPGCHPGPGGEGDLRGSARTVWLVLYPDCIDYRPPVTGDFGWVLIDAVKGVSAGSLESLPCERSIYPAPQVPRHRCRARGWGCWWPGVDGRETARPVAPL